MIVLAFATALIMTAQDYSARCLIEVAELTNQTADARTEEGRSNIRRKAAALDDLYDRYATNGDQLWRAIATLEAERRDLFENGLITEAEWAVDQAEFAATRAQVRDGLRDPMAPSCGFLDSHRWLPVFAAIERYEAERLAGRE